ncbi:hypothetical protein B9479_007830 [Cryptococcus floricola]|uniref:Uncharacterized protein n=1 Tax=Cryptococcus floricola TaxID=2591691 RepID=A0A5D3AND9_9TREE|nr:hypothetical protein B9479_007830 [Cryptococcus floricola]
MSTPTNDRSAGASQFTSTHRPHRQAERAPQPGTTPTESRNPQPESTVGPTVGTDTHTGPRVHWGTEPSAPRGRQRKSSAHGVSYGNPTGQSTTSPKRPGQPGQVSRNHHEVLQDWASTRRDPSTDYDSHDSLRWTGHDLDADPGNRHIAAFGEERGLAESSEEEQLPVERTDKKRKLKQYIRSCFTDDTGRSSG